MTVDFDCSDKATACVSVNHATTVAFPFPVLVDVYVKFCVLFVSRQLQNFCDRDITKFSTRCVLQGSQLKTEPRRTESLWTYLMLE